MANIKSQKKRALTNAKANLKNSAEKSRLKTAIKKVNKAVEAKDKVEQNTVADDRSPEQYAAEEVTEGMEKAVDDATIVADKTIRATGKKVKEKIKKRKAEKAEKTEN